MTPEFVKWAYEHEQTEGYANIHQDEADSQADFWIKAAFAEVERRAIKLGIERGWGEPEDPEYESALKQLQQEWFNNERTEHENH